jgi:hypothetical protein
MEYMCVAKRYCSIGDMCVMSTCLSIHPRVHHHVRSLEADVRMLGTGILLNQSGITILYALDSMCLPTPMSCTPETNFPMQ